MANKPRKTLGEKMILIAMVLVCLVAFSTWMMGGLMARYITRDDGNDSARVAKFDVAAVSTPNPLTMDYSLKMNPDNTVTITVSNSSEVAVSYSIELTMSDVPEYVTGITLDGNSGTKSGNTFTWNSVGQFPALSCSADHTLAFVIDFDELTRLETGNAITTNPGFTYTAKVLFTQID